MDVSECIYGYKGFQVQCVECCQANDCCVLMFEKCLLLERVKLNPAIEKTTQSTVWVAAFAREVSSQLSYLRV